MCGEPFAPYFISGGGPPHFMVRPTEKTSTLELVLAKSVGGVPVWRTPFVDEPGNNFHLHSSSPAIGAGDPADYPSVDGEGVARGNPPDAGALEYVP